MTNRLIRVKEVQHLTGLSRASIYNFMDGGNFPQSIPLGSRSVAWRESDINDWILSKITLRDKKLREKAKKKNEVVKG
ncbi:AlpA family transcriptional regulator [Vibrio coralliilyticus]|uniref:helix-turn-helix transcriptional regulator n=1 Tax=Vibrio coralliilyticus TaxID=190893 RepID=UPI002FD03D0A